MINDILAATGLQYWPVCCTNPPDDSYILYLDDVTTEDGPDRLPGAPLLLRHDCTVELYAPDIDPAAEDAIERAILAAGLDYDKQGRLWLKDISRYLTIYKIEYFEKKEWL